jgi:hypothetical protein
MSEKYCPRFYDNGANLVEYSSYDGNGTIKVVCLGCGSSIDETGENGCTTCGGDGWDEEDCSSCGGEGEVWEDCNECSGSGYIDD